MLGHGVRIWLAVLGLLGGLVLAPAPALSDCCPPPSAGSADTAAALSPADDCCPSTDREPPQPAGDEQGRCKCPRPCCLAPAPVATVRLTSPILWHEPAVGAVPLALVRPRSAEYHLDLMRPPRA